MARVRSVKDLHVWQNAMDVAMCIFALSKRFPPEERYSLTDQFRRASRSVASNIAEAWRRRRYPAAFINKLNEAEGEASETQTWTELALRCGYITEAEAADLDDRCEQVMGQLVKMIARPGDWSLKRASESDERPGSTTRDARKIVAPSPPRPLAPSVPAARTPRP